MKILKHLLLIVSSILTLFLFSSRVAASELSLETSSELGFNVIPSLSINYKHDDNITNTKNNQQASNLIEIMPALRIEGQKYNNKFILDYTGQQALYSENAENNYTDHQLKAELNRASNSRHQLAISYQFNLAHDAVNTGISEGNKQVTAPSRFYNQQVALSYVYGRQSSQARLKPRFSFNNKRYDKDNSSYTPMADFNEYDYGLAFDYHIGASLNLLLDISNRVSNYQGTANQKDSNNSLLYTGIHWNISGKTQGIVKIGYEKINFSDSHRESQANPSWDIGINWHPKTYSIFNINATQKITNAVTGTDSIEANRKSISWKHTWRYNLSSSLAYQHLNETYQHSAREDKSNAINLMLSYQLRYWLAFGLSYEHQSKSSSEVHLGYDKSIYGLTSSLVF
ncbi:outer membrane beta-barrel protein [Moritella sp. 36]|uniref:outer membrane beta-barrel protein n=1 Tax=Moritella sp. 36 TaxID=2746233 RepID=UPI001BA641C6|nr:outer membrane beta-barrel protein [Moritella sp. 36]QUM83194.1 outer membrane beta-barrel protein [Moritella sp. 28]QUM87496.1 outer membrane beta-barrel protein [Moritella sp. 36]